MQRIPMEHGPLLEVPGMVFRNLFELTVIRINQPDRRGFVLRGETIMKRTFQREQILTGPVPRTDAVVTKEMMPGATGQCLSFTLE